MAFSLNTALKTSVTAYTGGRGQKTKGEPSNVAVTVDYAVRLKGKWHFTGGLCYIKEKTKQSGTHVNACVGVGWEGKKVFVRYWHASHGASFEISEDKANSGWNFLIIGRRF